MPLVQDPSLVSPGTKRNPFTEIRTFLQPQRGLPSLVRSTAISDVGRLSLHSPTVYDALTRDSAVTSHAPRQKSTMRKTYIFSATDIRTLVASRGSEEGSGPNKLAFYLDWSIMNGITKWRNFKSGQGYGLSLPSSFQNHRLLLVFLLAHWRVHSAFLSRATPWTLSLL